MQAKVMDLAKAREALTVGLETVSKIPCGDVSLKHGILEAKHCLSDGGFQG